MSPPLPTTRPPGLWHGPELDYLPARVPEPTPGIGMIGCGGITEGHLRAYRQAGYRVVALCDVDRKRAASRADAFFPEATVYSDHRQLLERPDVEVVDITTHPPQRPPLIRDAIHAGKHVLSQKPFVEDLAVGQELADLADAHNVLLAVNQNGRWAPHFSYLRQVVAERQLGEIASAHFSVHWNHGWVKGTPFDDVRHLILYDFAIHWFDLLSCIMGDTPPQRVYASATHSGQQEARPALMGQACVEYQTAQASLIFDGDTRHGPWDRLYVTGSQGTFRSEGKDHHQQVAQLPRDEREVFELLWYSGITQREAALLLDISERTVLRRYCRARLQLKDALPRIDQ